MTNPNATALNALIAEATKLALNATFAAVVTGEVNGKAVSVRGIRIAARNGCRRSDSVRIEFYVADGKRISKDNILAALA